MAMKNDPGPKKVDSTLEVLEHYYEGDGSPVELGEETIAALKNDPDYRWVLERLMSGNAKSLTDHFDIHFTGKIFHVGDSNVDYATNCTKNRCVTTFKAFVNDGFRDPLDIRVEVPLFISGMYYIPRPYDYILYIFSVSYPNPGYPYRK